MIGISKESLRDGSTVTDEEMRPIDTIAAVSRWAVPLKTEVLQNAILNSADFAIIATDANGVIRLFNVGAERMLGYAASDVVNKIIANDMHDPAEVIARAERLSAEFATKISPGFDALAFKASRGIEDKYEVTKIRKDGSRFPAQVSVTALRDDQTKIIGYLFIGTDNSAAQAAIIAAKREKSAEEMFRQAVESCPSGMVMADSTGRIVLVNGEIERMFGYQRGELIGQSVDMIVPGHLYAEYIQHRDKLIAKPEIRHLAAGRIPVGRRKDGSKFPVEIGLNPVHTDDNLLVLSVIVDTSERKRMERLKDEVVSTVSHELRMPLTSISASLGLLVGQWSGKLPEMVERLITIAHTNSQRLVRLINDILDIEKLESGHVVFNLSQVDVRLLVEQAIEDNRGFAEGYGVHVRLDTASVEGEVKADPDRLAQVVTNLISNAIKFSPPDDEVVVAVEKSGSVVRISVRDHGSGVPVDFREHIFTKFAQADGTSRQKGGTGLGLSIVRQIVERLGGEVGFNDVPGGGTLFHVELPAWDGVAGREIDHEAEAGASRILLCEDDRDTAIAMRQGLRQAGFAVDFAYTMTVAIQRAAATRYAAILVELELPDGDGVGLILRLRAQAEYRNTPILVTAGDPEHGRNDVRSSRLNVLDWLVKPVDFEHLARVLKSGIALRPHERPRILHVDDDYDVLALVTHTLRATADVVSTDSIESARRALATERIDLAVLDILLGADSGLDLLPDLRDNLGNAIPVIVFSTHGAGFPCSEQVEAAFSKSSSSLESFVATVRDRLVLLPSRPALEVA